MAQANTSNTSKASKAGSKASNQSKQASQDGKQASGSRRFFADRTRADLASSYVSSKAEVQRFQCQLGNGDRGKDCDWDHLKNPEALDRAL